MIKPCKLSEIPGRNCIRDQTIINDLKDFVATSAVAGEVRVPEGTKAKYLYAKYRKEAIRCKYQIDVMVRGERLFIVKRTAARATNTDDSKKN